MPLSYHWIGDELLTDQLEAMAQGDAESRMTPALVFCFNRDECWNVAEQIKGKKLLGDGQQARLNEELARYEWSQGPAPSSATADPRRGRTSRRPAAQVSPHRRTFVPTEAAERGRLHGDAGGGHQPARPQRRAAFAHEARRRRSGFEPSAAHQIFGRAGRPQFDAHGHVYVLAHEDDVKIARWREQYDKIPEDRRTPGC